MRNEGKLVQRSNRRVGKGRRAGGRRNNKNERRNRERNERDGRRVNPVWFYDAKPEAPAVVSLSELKGIGMPVLDNLA
jgi:hypothetical protein